MRYHVTELVYRITPDGDRELRDKVSGIVNDNDGTALSHAEERFYGKIANELETEADMCDVDTTGNDYLHEQIWSLDEQGSMVALHIAITESQLCRNLAFGELHCKAESEDDMTGASMIGAAVVQSRYSDVEFERERLWKRRDGVFVLEVSRRFSVDNRIYWDSNKTRLSVRDAKAWARKYLNPIQYKTLFGDIAANDDRVPVNFLMRTDHKEKLKQRVAQDSKTFNELLDDALSAYLK